MRVAVRATYQSLPREEDDDRVVVHFSIVHHDIELYELDKVLHKPGTFQETFNLGGEDLHLVKLEIDAP